MVAEEPVRIHVPFLISAYETMLMYLYLFRYLQLGKDVSTFLGLFYKANGSDQGEP